MKKILNKILIAIAFTALVSSCQKGDLATNNPFVDINNFESIEKAITPNTKGLAVSAAGLVLFFCA